MNHCGPLDNSVKYIPIMTNEPGQKFRILQLVYGALFVSLFVYAGVVWFLSQSWDPASARGLKEFDFLLLAFVAISDAAAIPMVKKILMNKIASTPDAAAKIQVFFSAHIVTFAMAEFILILGLAATFLLKNYTALFPFLGMAVLLFLLYAPKRAAFDDMLR